MCPSPWFDKKIKKKNFVFPTDHQWFKRLVWSVMVNHQWYFLNLKDSYKAIGMVCKRTKKEPQPNVGMVVYSLFSMFETLVSILNYIDKVFFFWFPLRYELTPMFISVHCILDA